MAQHPQTNRGVNDVAHGNAMGSAGGPFVRLTISI